MLWYYSHDYIILFQKGYLQKQLKSLDLKLIKGDLLIRSCESRDQDRVVRPNHIN